MLVLLVEDEPVISLAIQETLSELGHTPLAARTNAEAALIIESHHIDVAVLDVSLPDGLCLGLARLLTEKQVPFAFSTGRGPEVIAGFADAPVLSKPFDDARLQAVLETLRPHIRNQPQLTDDNLSG